MVDSRQVGFEKKRRRQCLNEKGIACGRRFNTYEEERTDKLEELINARN